MIRFARMAALTLPLLAAPAFAGDANKGEAQFKKCKSCHAIVAADGTAIVKGGLTGPNLYGIIGRQIASYPDFDYGASILAVGADGSRWDEASLTAYIVDPTLWLIAKTADPKALAKMRFRLPKGGADVAAYLALVAKTP